MGSNQHTEDECYVLGGGTFSHIRNHLSLAAVSYGSTAKKIAALMRVGNPPHDFYPPKVKLHLTKMADSSSSLETVDDVSRFIDSILERKETKIIFFSIAMCDFEGEVADIKSGKYSERLSSAENYSLSLSPAEKVISKIKKRRPDILLIGFKTTTNKSEIEQEAYGKGLIDRSSANLVLANDTVTRNNLILDQRKVIYSSKNRDEIINSLVQEAKNKFAAGTYSYFDK
jgi:hypothetical protein